MIFLKKFLDSFGAKCFLIASTFSGFLLIFYPFYMRLVRSTLPVEFQTELMNKQHYIVLIVYSLCTLIWIYVFIISLRTLLHECFKLGSQPKDSRFAIIIKKFTQNAVLNFYNLIDKIPKIERFYEVVVVPLFLFLSRYINTRQRMVLLTIFINFVPKTIFTFCFVFDVFINHSFKYVYIFGPLLLIPMFERYLLFWFSLYRAENLSIFNTCLCLFHKTDLHKTYKITEYILRNMLIEFDNSLQNRNYIIKTSFPVAWNDCVMGLDYDYHMKNIETIPHYNSSKTFQSLVAKLQNFHLPIMIFGDFYGTFQKQLTKYFIVFQALIYAITWFSLLFYVI